ncbi:Alpha/Beta hydrolase protein [Dissophora ornata]|nr:Alpha/Beta hydrolase protein [Dissophora ornata]
MSPSRIHLAKQGTIEGSLDPKKKVVRFLNVPFGTVVERWRPAVTPEPWTGIRDATKQGPVAPQPRGDFRYSKAINSYSGFDFDDETTVFDERDCLNLNIYVHEDTLNQAARVGAEHEGGECDTRGGAAVMVYIHGGAFRDGANAMDVFDGSNLVRQSVKIGRPVIVVVLNYRLNFLGNFSCPELVAELRSDPRLTSDYDRSTGNWGLMDQRLAFEWVHTHIKAFGGQVNNITAFGESVGAVSINYHMLISQHRGLFHRAIMQSCAMNSAPAVRPEIEGKIYFDFLIDYFDIPKDLSGEEKLGRLKRVSGLELGRAAESTKLRMFTPYVDGIIVPEDVRLWTHKTELYDHGVKAVIVGDMKDEGTMFVESLGTPTLAGWPRILEKYCPPDEESRNEWEAIYGKVESDADATKASIEVVEHSLFTYPEFSALRALSKREDLGKGRFELFRYYFDRSIAAVDAKGKGWGAHHGVDLVFVFGPDLAIETVFTEEEKRFSERIQTTWILFAYGETSSKEHFPAIISRPADDYEYHAKEKEAIVFTKQCTVEKEKANRHGERVLKIWGKSERWVHEMRESKKDSEEALRAGLLCINQPSESEWS